MTYATAADVARLMARELSTEDVALAERRLAQVERKILRKIPDLAEQIDAEEIDQADVVDVEAEAVYRVMRNPEGLFSEQDGAYGYQLSREAADNSLRIISEEWVLLGIKPSRMFQISPSIGGVAL